MTQGNNLKNMSTYVVWFKSSCKIFCEVAIGGYQFSRLFRIKFISKYHNSNSTQIIGSFNVCILKCNSICDNHQIWCIWKNKSETYIYFQFKQCEKNWRNLEDFYSDLDVHYKWARPLSSIHWADLLGLIIIMAVGCGILCSGNKTYTDFVLSRLDIDWIDTSTKFISIYVIMRSSMLI